MRATWVVVLLALTSCKTTSRTAATSYLDYSSRDDVLSGGVKMIPVKTQHGELRVWTKRIGNNPRVKVLLLNGGPGLTHEYLEAFDSYFPNAGFEYYYYDQLDTGNSDRPAKPELWNVARYVDEIEQVRIALGLDTKSFFLYGHSWGGVLAIEYALKYQQNLRGLVISNMMASAPAYNQYANDVLIPKMDPKVIEEVRQLEADKKYDEPRYTELLFPTYYQAHVLRMPPERWPEPVLRSLSHANKPFYVAMQGPSEMGLSGVLTPWDRTADLKRITVPTLTIGATHDTMDPTHMEWMSKQVVRGRYHHCANGSHLAMYDDQRSYFAGVVQFIRDVDNGAF